MLPRSSTVAIQRKAAEAWLECAPGNGERAITLAREAAEMESTTEKNPVTPGEVLPAQELYGDMLLAAGQHRDAVATAGAGTTIGEQPSIQRAWGSKPTRRA